MLDPAAEPLEDRPSAAERAGLAAHHHREGPRLGAVGAAAHRRVHEPDAPLGQASGDAPRARRIARGAVDQQRAAAKTRQETVGTIEHRFDLARGRETGEHELPRGRGIARCGGDHCLMAGGEPLGHRPGPVPHREPPALGQMGRHRRAHGAEADEGDRRQGHFERYRYEE
jgi:hypothetical protein